MTPAAGKAPALGDALAAAPDCKLGRIVGMLDGMLERGEADRLLAPLRPRLAQLGPARPLRFPRLLAMPLEGALVSPDAWRGVPSAIPRSALAPLAEAMRTALGEAAEEIEIAGLGHSVAETALVGRLGRRLWPLAGAVALPVPAGWEAAGLPRAAAAPILKLCAALWRHGGWLWEARQAVAHGPPEASLRAALARLAPEGPAALAAGTALLLRHAAMPDRVAALAAALRPEVAPLAEAALAAELARRAGGADQSPRG
jgi:hypothetical protein